PDTRGVALGKQGAALFATVDALVGWFRVISDELALEDLLPSLAIHEVRSGVQSREFLVLFAAASSYLCDRAARVARLLGALWITCAPGLGSHLLGYLWRSRVSARATLVEREARSAFAGEEGGARRYLLVHVESLPARMAVLFREVPGIALYRAVADNVAIE